MVALKQFSFLFFLVLIVSNFSFAQSQTLTATEFKTKLQETPGAVLLDVRTPAEVQKGFIQGATNIDFNAPDFRAKIATLDKDKTYFVYCAKGVRSSKAVDVMQELGFKKINNLEEGFVGWNEKGLPIIKK